jgi:AcrR family transcriptional regulator
MAFGETQVRCGWQALATNAIAERARVNIASLYQFFPNKEAIVAELERRHIQETRDAVTAVYARHRGEGVEARARALVEAGIAAHAVALEIHQVFATTFPGRHSDRSFEPFIIEGGRADLSALGLPHPDLATWVIATVTHAVIHQGIVERRGDVESGALAEELVTMLVRCVRRPRKGRR